jgi:hypothetical protein
MTAFEEDMNTTDRAFGKVALGREHLLADGLGEEEGTARVHGEVQAIALGGDVEQVASRLRR